MRPSSLLLLPLPPQANLITFKLQIRFIYPSVSWISLLGCPTVTYNTTWPKLNSSSHSISSLFFVLQVAYPSESHHHSSRLYETEAWSHPRLFLVAYCQSKFGPHVLSVSPSKYLLNLDYFPIWLISVSYWVSPQPALPASSLSPFNPSSKLLPELSF